MKVTMNFPKNAKRDGCDDQIRKRGKRHVADAADCDHEEHGNILTSKRPVSREDVDIVGANLGSSWRILGHRLNFDVQTLDRIDAMHNSEAQSYLEEVGVHLLRIWSELPSANVGRLAFILWEMGRHDIALQLAP